MTRTWLPLALALAALGQQPDHREDPSRGETPARSRTPTQGHGPGPASHTWNGLLVSAGCRDRAAAKRAAKSLSERAGNRQTVRASDRGTGSAQDQAPSGQTAGALEHHNRQHRSRQPSGGPCAVSAGTRGFALLMPEGRWLDLDEAGDTLVAQALRTTQKGRDLLSGAETRAQYFHASIQGSLERQDRLKVQSVRLE